MTETFISSSDEDKEHRAFPTPAHGTLDAEGIIQAFAHRMMYSVAKNEYSATAFDVFQALAFAMRDRLMERWFQTQSNYYEQDCKRVYYLSLEFLMGRALLNNALNLGALDDYREAVEKMGYSLEQLQSREKDAGLGNGGLGRLAACFLDSAATLALPFYGYGIRYEYGIFRQQIHQGFQVEEADNWLRSPNPWEIPQSEVIFPVCFYGSTRFAHNEKTGGERVEWIDAETIYAMAYDTPIVGYRNDTVNTLRLWAAKSSREFDLGRFNSGDYVRSVEDKNETENISKVLYPPDDQYAGKELRLKQQYFFVAATLQDVLRRFRKKDGREWSELPDEVAIQLNDTHPAVAIPELMRLLIDQENLAWDAAWPIVQAVFGYTNHTILPEALETWSIELFGRLLPRHVQIIEEIDRRFQNSIREAYPGDEEKVRRMSIIARDETPRIRMANLAIVGSHSVNGVAKLHTEIIRNSIFPEFDSLFPGRFNNKTNGITPRRWLLHANPRLASLINEAIGDGWTRDLDVLRGLEPFADDATFREKWNEVKRENKVRLVEWTRSVHSIDFSADALFDCQVKRIHEYKRQLLNVLHVISLIHKIRNGEEVGPPRNVIFAGKAAPSYFIAKLVIKLIHAVADVVNREERLAEKIRVIFIPNYNVTTAEHVFPACDLSEQISTAGTEASGTGNMKAALNGSLTIGTLDGANVEISEEVGTENMFIFGHTADEITALRSEGYDPRSWVAGNPELAHVIRSLSDGSLPGIDIGTFQPISDILLGSDRYFHCADFGPYVEAQRRAMATYQRGEEWARMSILNVARMGKFSADRTIRQYSEEIWNTRPAPVTFK